MSSSTMKHEDVTAICTLSTVISMLHLRAAVQLCTLCKPNHISYQLGRSYCLQVALSFKPWSLCSSLFSSKNPKNTKWR